MDEIIEYKYCSIWYDDSNGDYDVKHTNGLEYRTDNAADAVAVAEAINKVGATELDILESSLVITYKE